MYLCLEEEVGLGLRGGGRVRVTRRRIRTEEEEVE